MLIGERIKQLRTIQGLSQRQLALKAGLDPSYLSIVESGRRTNITLDVAQRLSGILNVGIEELMGVESGDKSGLSDKSVADMLKTFTSDFADKLRRMEIVEIPVRGVIPAGNPAAEEEIDLGVIRVPREVVEGKIDRVFALKIGGESLNGDGLHSGDNVLIDPDAPIIDGKIYAVRIGGTEVLARHVYKENGHLRLESSNGEYKRLLATDVEIQGRLIYQMRKL
ncbi:MAG: XRE family transcriptional regulator [Dehalococcoides mccartyi]|uniref:helix-turn-helix domain-containing protein n=1 Tax=Dehalococcoides mccartyi TaxID=61435 RepID=UPI0025CB55C4|nr:XRE family transcriptional regulator [Dehalococcoides mccartyi]MDN4185547.1 XRE family transcriptional regulator [Dehalococcoides mccartyi]